jgi:hypothetical protein
MPRALLIRPTASLAKYLQLGGLGGLGGLNQTGMRVSGKTTIKPLVVLVVYSRMKKAARRRPTWRIDSRSEW